MDSKNYKQSNPIEEEKLMNSFAKFFSKFDKFFENAKVDEIVNREFNREYALLPLLVKAKMYYDEN